MKGIMIESVAWNSRSTDESTSQILVGSHDGFVYETVIEPSEEFFKREDRYCKLVFSLQKPEAITGLHLLNFPTQKDKSVCFLSTQSKLYQFIGAINEMFTLRENVLEFEVKGKSELCFSPDNQSFVWMTGIGMYYGQIVFGSQSAGQSVIENSNMIPFLDEKPLSVVVTRFHFILLYKRRIKSISILDNQTVFQQELSQDVSNLVVDVRKQTYWFYSKYEIYELVIEEEDKNVWKIYFDKKRYDLALKHAKTFFQRDKIWISEGQNHFDNKRYILAADSFSKSTKKFEEVVLMFHEKGAQEGLKRYLLAKLEKLDPEQKIQITLISTWLLEIYLNMLESMRDDKEATYLMSQELCQFLADPKVASSIDKKTTLKTLLGRNHVEEFVHYATLVQDFESVTRFFLGEKNYKQALKVLSQDPSNDNVYCFSHLLVQKLPTETVDLWLSRPSIEPEKLIPSLLNCVTDHQKEQASRYIEQIMFRNDSLPEVLCNFLLSLYASEGKEKEIIDLISLEVSVDLQFALQQCLQNKLTNACMLIYGLMGFYEESVEMAIRLGDLEKAREQVQKCKSADIQFHLLLKIAKKILESERIEAVIDFIHTCSLTLEDILPFVPEFTEIGDWKEEICANLKAYNEKIGKLKVEMNSASKSVDTIRSDIEKLQFRKFSVTQQDKCMLCKLSLLNLPIYAFSCNHFYHYECIKKIPEYKNTCLHCGDYIIDLIDKPYSTNEEEINSWKV